MTDEWMTDEWGDDVIKSYLCPLTDVCVVLLTEGVKFRVLCEEPGTALHLMMEVRPALCFCACCNILN